MNWEKPYYVDESDFTPGCDPATDPVCHVGHQIMPSLSYVGGKLTLLFYDFREDYYPDLYNTILKNVDCSLSADPVKCGEAKATVPLDESLPPADAVAFEPFPVRHTIDARIVVADVTKTCASSSSIWPFCEKESIPVSKYASTILPDLSEPNPPKPLKLYPLQSNQVNLPLFLKGTSPFIGDYIDISPSQPFVFDTINGEWKYNNNSSDTSIFHAVWTDNRDVMPPPAKIVENVPGELELERPDWTEDEPPTGVVLSEDYWPGMRNQNIYTSRITQGLVLGTYGNSKPLAIDRAFSIFVENTIPEFEPNFMPKSKWFKLTLDTSLDPSSSVVACFEPISNTTTPICNQPVKVVNVTSLSSLAVTVFVKKLSGTNSLVPIGIKAEEVTSGGAVVSKGLQSSLVLNPDPTNPEPLNADAGGKKLAVEETRNLEFVPFSCLDFEGLPAEVLTNCGGTIGSVSSLLIKWPVLFDISDPTVPDPTLLNPALLNTTENPALLNPALLNPALLNPALMNPALLNPALIADTSALELLSPALMNPALLNPALLNPALLNPALLNPALMNPALLNPALMNPALLNPALMNPALMNPALLNPALMNPALMSPALMNPSPGTGNSLNLGEIAKNTWLIQDKDLDPVASTAKPVTLTDLTWRVKNIGNNGSSYLFSWNSSTNLPLNPSQILVYRTYRTPSIDPGSYLLNEAGLHYEFLLNVLDASLLTPGLQNKALSFSLAPSSSLLGEEDEDCIYITLRFNDTDGQDGPNDVNPDQVAVTVEPEAPASGISTPAETLTFTSLFSSQSGPDDHGRLVTLTATVNSTSATPVTGMVDFFDGNEKLNSQQISLNHNQQAFFKTSSLPTGNRSIKAVYSGVPGQFRKSTSEPVIQHVKKLKQSINFKIVFPNLLATAKPSGLPVSFSTHSKNCSIVGNRLRFNGSGNCVVKASQAGDDIYLPAPPVVQHVKVP